MKSVRDLFLGIPLFRGFTPQDLNNLAGSVRERFMRSGEVLVHRGDPGASMMVVLEGEARVELPDSSGTSLVLQVLRAGEAFGELALFDGKPPQCGRRGCDKWPATDFRAPRGA